ncbi:HAD-like domain-containing protein [Astrocystis sublimbata]|nr:HAD-like domain-containing protein [Astrocystis sublimbata]
MSVGLNCVLMRSSIARSHSLRLHHPFHRHSLHRHSSRPYSLIIPSHADAKSPQPVAPPRSNPPSHPPSNLISIMSAGGNMAGSAGYPIFPNYAANGLPPRLPEHTPGPGRPQTMPGATTPNSHAPAHVRRVAPRSPSPQTAAVGKRDKICQPSAESGGVPDPTAKYLRIASQPPFLLPQPRNILVVVDLNGTLLHRPSRHAPTRFIERPNAQPFLSYCVNTFTVVVWSSARSQNVVNMCNQLLSPEDKAKVVAVWSRDNFGLSKSDYNSRVQCYKRLTALWNNPVVAASHPLAASGEKWNQLNTVLVDDSMEKARSEPFNLIQIPEFEGHAQEPGFVLPQVHDYLNACSQQANISAYMKTQPFRMKPNFTL